VTDKVERFIEGYFRELDQSHFRDEPVERQRLISTEFCLANFETREFKYLASFLSDLVKRAPLNGPAFTAHRVLLQALAYDLRAAAEAEKHES